MFSVSSQPKPRFVLRSNARGELALFCGGRAIPVNEAYLKHVFESRGEIPPPGKWRPIEPDVARDVIEEALGAVGHELSSAESLKRNLVSWFDVADSAAHRRSKAIA